MATWQHLRSSTANKRPTTSLADGRIAINTNTASPGLFFKDSAGTGIVKVGPVHVGTTAPNSVPAAGGSSGNYTGEQWLDTSVSPAQMKVWNGSTWVGIVADELPVSKLQDGAARQLIQTDAAGTGVEWTSDVDVPGTLDVTSTATFDSIAQHPLGTAGAPTITFTGDNNTGIYSPGADQVAISTNSVGRLLIGSAGAVTQTLAAASNNGFAINNGTNDLIAIGTGGFAANGGSVTDGGIRATNSLVFATGSGAPERLRITAAGLVGVGTSSPSNKLNVVAPPSASGVDGIALNNGTRDAISLYVTGSSYSYGSIGSTQTWLYANEGDLNITNDATGVIKFSGDLGVERMRIDAQGRVGVGTTSPAEKLHVVGDGVRIDRVGGDPYIDFYTSGSANNVALYGGSSTGFRAFVGGSERLRIDSSGRVGIGTSSPNGTLDVKIAAGRALYFSERNSQPALTSYAPDVSNNNRSFGYHAFTHSFYVGSDTGTSTSEVVRIDNAGRVGIGTTTVSETLHLRASAPRIRIEDAEGGYSNIEGDNGSLGIYADNGNTQANSFIRFDIDSTEKARLTASGQLLVGTSSARTTQHSIGGNNVYDVVANVQHERTGEAGGFSVVVNKDDASGPFLNLAKARGSSVGSNTIVASGDVLGTIGFFGADGSDITSWGGAIQCFVDGTPGANDMPGRLVFSTTADGASSPTERMRIGNDGRASTFCSSTTNNLALAHAAGAGTTYKLIEGAYGATGVNTGTESFRVYTNGNVQNTNNSYGAISDIKLKENIVDATPQWDDIKALQVRNYNFKEGQTHTQIGLIAQEVELVSPGLVSESPDRDAEGNDLGTVTKSVNYSVLYMKAVKALQEAMERIETLEAKVAALETP